MKQQSKIRWILAAVLAAVLVALFLGCWALTRQERKEPENPSASESTVQTTEPEASSSEPSDSVPPAPSKTPAAPSGDETLPEPAVAAISQDQWYLALVNRSYQLPEGFSIELADVVSGSDRQFDARCAGKYTEMYDAAKADGCNLWPYSGHRRHSTQERNYNNKVNLYVNQGYSLDAAKVKAATIILPPGTSEHELGLAMDIVNTETSFENTEEFTWLMEHGADYGFILRYPKDKQEITKITYEPWHWRYVGVKDAKAMKASGQCLEEYLGLHG